MCKFCKYQRVYYPEKHHELPPGTSVDARITSRNVSLPSDDDYTFVMESMVDTATRFAYKETKKYNFEYAERLLVSAHECQPRNSKVYDLYALFYLQQENFDLALENIKISLRLNNSNGESFLIASHIYKHQQKLDMALRALEIGLVCVPTNNENADVRKSLNDEIAKLKAEHPTLAQTPGVATESIAKAKNDAQSSPFLPERLSQIILEVLFSNLDFGSAKHMELVSKDWQRVAKSDEIQTEMLLTHAAALVELLELPKNSFTLPMFNGAFKFWKRMETNERIREKVTIIPRISKTIFEAPANFSTPKYQIQKEILQIIPKDFLLVYSIHNGMKMHLNGVMRKNETYTCTLYPLDSPKFAQNPAFNAVVPVQFRSEVRQDFTKNIVIGKIKMSAPAHEPTAYDIWSDWKFGDDSDDEEAENPNNYILLDTNPNTNGTIGQLLIVEGEEDRELVDVLKGGISQLLEYLTILDTCNLVSTLGMFTRDVSDNHLPEFMEKSLSKLTVKPKPKKLGSLYKEMKRYKSAQKAFQCSMRR